MSERHRVFIAINLPEDIRKKLNDYQDKWSELPVRWTNPKNIHITLVFIGYVNNDELLEICRIAKEAVSKHQPFLINLNKICYGPPHSAGQALNKMPSRPPKFSEEKFWRPRMIWAIGEKSQEFAGLRDVLEKSLTSSQEVSYSPEKREFSPHITLGRIRQWEWRRIEPEERPEINEDINLNFSVDSVEIMESQLKRGGAEYTILESIPLQ